MSTARTIVRALVAGAVAVTINIWLLDLCDAAGIVTARGGLQRLVKLWLARPTTQLGVADLWAVLGLPGPDTNVFKTGFKVTVGLGMAVFYALVIDRQIPGSTLLKGLGYALFVWLLNAFVVLPLLGEGIAGARLLTVLGMVCFALAHTAFFIILAYLYAALDGTLKFPTSARAASRPGR